MTSPRSTTRRRGFALTSLAAITLLVALSACSGGGEDGATESTAPATAAGGAGSDLSDAEADAPEAADSLAYAAQERGAQAPQNKAQQDAGSRTVSEPALIATGNVALRADDVGQARFEVQKIVDGFGGQIGQEKTEADEEGEVERARLVVRVPTDDFEAAMEALEDVGDLTTTRTNVDDVTTEVIDTDVRVRLQQRSIERIELLLDRAQSIRDIVSIERQLSRREADLTSLEQQQAFLADQTSMGTITVSLERPAPKDDPDQDSDDETGFLAGLENGWKALSAMTVGLLTAGGAALPFALLAGLLVLIARPVLRRLRRTPPQPATAEA